MPRKSPIAKLVGDKQLVRKLQKLAAKTAKGIEKKVLRAGAAAIKKSVKRHVPVDQGHLKKAIDFKLTGKGGAVVGANADYFADGERPANYVHLVEYGFMAEDGSVVPGQHPIERGSAAAQHEAADKMTAKLKSELHKRIK